MHWLVYTMGARHIYVSCLQSLQELENSLLVFFQWRNTFHDLDPWLSLGATGHQENTNNIRTNLHNFSW